jgi:hypothetical protein
MGRFDGRRSLEQMWREGLWRSLFDELARMNCSCRKVPNGGGAEAVGAAAAAPAKRSVKVEPL